MPKARYGALLVAIAFLVGMAQPVVAAASSGRSREIKKLGMTVTVPNGWHERKPSAGQIGLFTDRSSIGENCTLATDKTTILLAIRPVDASTSDVPQRPTHFGPTSGRTVTSAETADLACDATTQNITFYDHGKMYAAFLTMGADAPPQQRKQAYRILDSLRTEKT